MTFSKALKILQGIAATFLVGFVFLMALPFLPLNGTVELFSVRSGSMEPALPTGSLIFVRPANEYKAGDIITVQTSDKKTVTHRIVEVLNTDIGVAFRTKGDNNEEPDPTEVILENVIGKNFLTLPMLGYLVAYTQTKSGFLSLIVFPAVLIILKEALTIIQEVRRVWQKRNRVEYADGAVARNVTFAPMPQSAYPSVMPRIISTAPQRRRIV